MEQLNLQKDKKLKEQNAIIQAQVSKIAQLELEFSAKSNLVSEYEQKFVQVREAVADDKVRSQRITEAL